MIEPVDDQDIETEPARFHAQDRIAASSASCFQTLVLSHFFEIDTDIPATDEGFVDALDTYANGSVKEVFDAG